MRSMQSVFAVALLAMAGLWLTACDTGEAVTEAVDEAVAETAAAVGEAAAIEAAGEAVGDCAEVDEECCEAEVAPEGCPDCGEVDCCCDKDKKKAVADGIPADRAEEYAKALEECGGCTHCAHAKLGIDMGDGAKSHGAVHGKGHGDGGCPHAGKDSGCDKHKSGKDCDCDGKDKAHGEDCGCGKDKAKTGETASKDVAVQG